MAKDQQGPTLGQLGQKHVEASKPTIEDGRTVVHVRYRRGGGPALEGAFHIRVPNLADDMEIARQKVVLAGGTPWNLIAPEDQQLYEAMAVCNVLIENPKPAFFLAPIQHLDRVLVIALAVRIRQWESEFFRGGPESGPGKQAQPRVEFLSPVGGGDE